MTHQSVAIRYEEAVTSCINDSRTTYTKTILGTVMNTQLESKVSASNYTEFIITIIKDAVTHPETGEGTSYLESNGGKYWCDLIGLKPTYLIRKFKEEGFLCRLSPRRWW